MPKDLNANRKETIQDTALDAKMLLKYLEDPATEVTEDELNQVLEEELDKPEAEMDLNLVDELLETLEPVEADQETIAAGAKKLSQQLRAKDKRGFIVYLRRGLIAAAAVVLLFFVTWGSARAMRWTFLLKYLDPIAQTFGIATENHEDESDQRLNMEMSTYTANVETDGQVIYQSEDDVPLVYEGYRIKLSNIPEGFQLISGSLMATPETKTFNQFYQAGEEWLSYTVYFFESDEDALGFLYEKSIEEPYEKTVGMRELTFYHNSDDDTLSVSWIERNAHYSIVGYITEEELAAILEGFGE